MTDRAAAAISGPRLGLGRGSHRSHAASTLYAVERPARSGVMHIDRIELFHVAMPLIYPWRTAYGEDATVHSVLCRMTSGSLAAWGECSSLAAPCYSSEWAGGVFAVAKEWLAPAIVGQSIESGEQLHQRLAHFKGNMFAKAALDSAWW